MKHICFDSSALKTHASLLRTRRESSTKTQDEKTHSCLEGFCRKAAICSGECQKMQPKFRRQKNRQHLHLKVLAAAFETDLTDYSPLCSCSYTVCTYSSIHQFSITGNQVSSLWCFSLVDLEDNRNTPYHQATETTHCPITHLLLDCKNSFRYRKNRQKLITLAAKIELTNNNMCNIHFIVCMNNIYAVYETN